MDSADASDASLPATASTRSHDVFDRSVRVETLTTDASSNAVKAEALCLYLGSRCLLNDAELKIPEVRRSYDLPQADGSSRQIQSGTTYGLVGQNGCGKTTLLRVVSEGRIPTPASWDVMLVGQHLAPAEPRTAIEEILASNAQLTALRAEQAELESQLASPPSLEEDGVHAVLQANSRLTAVQRELSSWAGAGQEIEKLLVSLGFRRQSSELEQTTSPAVDAQMQHLSGGWRMKVELAKALWLKPKLLLLDEPTNHLDFEALRWLEQQLDLYPHTVVVVSHHVSFLHCSCQEIFWFKDKKLETLPVDAVSQEDLARMQRTKALDFTFSVPSDGNLQQHGVSLHSAEFRYPGLHVLAKGDIRFSCNSRAVVLGRNGTGKSTFLGLCTGAKQPSAGTVDRTQDCQVGFYSQQMDELEKHADGSAVDFLMATRMEELQARLGVKTSSAARAAERRGDKPRVGSALGKRLREVARGVLSGFGFEGDLAVSVPVGSLSGGQKARLKLAALSIRPAHLLFLDEPTNHLDAEACEALANGLSAFKGGIVVVTHDDLLIYRLIQCNWAESQLLTSRKGAISLKREFGGHCLKTLKKELRQSEMDVPSVPDPMGQLPAPKVKPSNVDMVPRAPAGGAAALPPWLAKVRAGRRDKAADVVHVVPDSAKTTEMPEPCEGTVSETEVPCQDSPTALSQDVARLVATNLVVSAPEDSSAGSAPIPTGLEATVAMPPWLAARRVRSSRAQQVRASALSTEAPAKSREVVLEATSTTDDVEALVGGSEASPLSWSEVVAECWCDQLRKDIANLEKSMAKWLAHEDIGVLSRAKLLEKIRSSIAMRKLAERNGAGFQHDAIAKLALQHASAEKCPGRGLLYYRGGRSGGA